MAYSLSTSPNRRTHGNERLLGDNIFAYTQLHEYLTSKGKESNSIVNTKGKSKNFRWANKHCNIPDQMVDSLPEMEMLMKPTLTLHTENTKNASNISRPLTAPSRKQQYMVSKGKSEIENRIARRINNARQSELKLAKHTVNGSESYNIENNIENNNNNNSEKSSSGTNNSKEMIISENYEAQNKGVSVTTVTGQQRTNILINRHANKKQAASGHSTSKQKKLEEEEKAQIHSEHIDKRTHAWNKEIDRRQTTLRRFASSSSSSSSSESASSPSSIENAALFEAIEEQPNRRSVKQCKHNKRIKRMERNEPKLFDHRAKSKMSEMMNGKFVVSEPLRISECYGIVGAKREKESVDKVSDTSVIKVRNEECRSKLNNVSKALAGETNLAFFLKQEKSDEGNANNVHEVEKNANIVHEHKNKSPLPRKKRQPSKFMRELKNEPLYSYRLSLYASCKADQCARLDSRSTIYAQTISYCSNKWDKAKKYATNQNDELVQCTVDKQNDVDAQSVNNGCAKVNQKEYQKHNIEHVNKYKSKMSTMKEMVERQRHNFEHARFVKHANLSDYLAERDRCRYNVEYCMLNSDYKNDEVDGGKCGDINKNVVSADDAAVLSRTESKNYGRYIFEPLLKLCHVAYPRRVQPTHRPESMWTAKAHQLALLEEKKRTSKQIREYKLPFAAASLSLEAMQMLQNDIIGQVMKSRSIYTPRKDQYSKNDLMKYLIKRNNLQSGLAHLYQPQPSDVIDLMPSPAEAALVSFIFEHVLVEECTDVVSANKFFN